MRSPDYVAVVVSIYRRALDAVANGSFVPQQSRWMSCHRVLAGFHIGIYLRGPRTGTSWGVTGPTNGVSFSGQSGPARGMRSG